MFNEVLAVSMATAFLKTVSFLAIQFSFILWGFKV